jgi:hypothetical protein
MPTPELKLVNRSTNAYYIKARKRLFIGLVTGTCFLVCFLLTFLWIIPYIGFAAIHPVVPWIASVMVIVIVLLVLGAAFGLVINITFAKTLPLFTRMRGVTVKLFLPLMMLLGRTLGISKKKIRSSFIQVNNELVSSGSTFYAPQEILLLMPHCLQNSHCKMRLTYNVNNCKRCGRCPLTGLLSLSEKYGLHLAVATGGTIARRIVVEKHPKLILAVACERDLSAGIQDTYPIPVYGVLNIRPHGPCLDTHVSLTHLEEAIRLFLDPRFLHLSGAAATPFNNLSPNSHIMVKP